VVLYDEHFTTASKVCAATFLPKITLDIEFISPNKLSRILMMLQRSINFFFKSQGKGRKRYLFVFCDRSGA
jgi:hypothetical protein